MAKRTTKYVRALEVAEHLAIAEVNNQEALYQLLKTVLDRSESAL